MSKLILTAALTFAVIFGLAKAVFANNPGGHAVILTWVNGACPSGATCTVNIYKGTTAGVCGDGKTPFATGISGTTYEDDTVVAGTSYFYNVTTMPSVGGESSCATELQESVPSVSAGAAAQVQGSVH